MNKKTIFIIVISVVVLALGSTIYLMARKMNNSNKKIKELENNLQTSGENYFKLMNSKDSLLHVNSFLAKYKALTVAMTYRDNVRLPLQYNIGDKVYLKRDSSKVIVSDIIVGGGKYEYYLKYKVMGSDGQEEEIVPELVY